MLGARGRSTVSKGGCASRVGADPRWTEVARTGQPTAGAVSPMLPAKAGVAASPPFKPVDRVAVPMAKSVVPTGVAVPSPNSVATVAARRVRSARGHCVESIAVTGNDASPRTGRRRAVQRVRCVRRDPASGPRRVAGTSWTVRPGSTASARSVRVCPSRAAKRAKPDQAVAPSCRRCSGTGTEAEQPWMPGTRS